MVLGIVGTIAAALLMFYTFNRTVYSLLSEQRRPFTASVLSSQETAAAEARVLAFSDAVHRRESPPALELTADEVNALIDGFAAARHIEVPARVSFAGDKIHAELSVPLRGMYLNGSGELSVGLRDGVLLVFATSLELNGKPAGEAFMQSVRTFNIASPFMEDPALKRVLAELEYVTVTNGKLKITPKAKSG